MLFTWYCLIINRSGFIGFPAQRQFRFGTYNSILLTGERVPRLIWVKLTHRNKSDRPRVDEASGQFLSAKPPCLGGYQEAEAMAAPYFGPC